MKLETNDKFTISYTAKTHNGIKLKKPLRIFRKGLMTDIAKGEFTTKKGNKCFNYWDINENGYRTASAPYTLIVVGGNDESV
mgnify:FL=1|jgi:hypothetical protein|tara:strand:+ start:124 stop:369 length:246 start_codon:yes stop_codon:yes gene_type:complete